jgi:hypothetical protein
MRAHGCEETERGGGRTRGPALRRQTGFRNVLVGIEAEH